jgi:hypothetical protein
MPDPKQTIKGAYHVVKIDVTQPLIDRAEQRHSGHCMVADAIRLAMPHVRSVSVDLATIRFTDPAKHQRYVYLTPYHVQRSLIDFDQGVHNQAFNFHLRKAAQVLESGYKTTQDGTKKRPSRANQGVVGASSRKQPIRLGGEHLPVGDLSSKSTKRKTTGTMPPASKVAAATKKPSRQQRIDATYKAAEKAAADRAKGKPVADASNITLAPTNERRVREFGLKQLRP